MKSIEATIEKLREKGVKVTPQRIAILEFLEKNRIHPNAENIYSHILKEHPSMSLATVYNTLDKLEEISEVIKLKISDDNKVNYEFDLKPHHHFFCKKCKSIFDIEMVCANVDKLSVEGHKVEEVHGYFKGICKKCKEGGD